MYSFNLRLKHVYGDSSLVLETLPKVRLEFLILPFAILPLSNNISNALTSGKFSCYAKYSEI